MQVNHSQWVWAMVEGYRNGFFFFFFFFFFASEIELTKNSSSSGTRLPENSCFSGAGLAASERGSY